MIETWKPVPIAEFSSKYEVSDAGRIRNAATKHVLIPMRTGTKRSGSQLSKVRFSTTPRRDYDVSHLVLEAFVSRRPQGFIVMHLDDDSSNNSVSNIRWGTLSENVHDCVHKLRGGAQRIGADTAKEIACRRATGETGVALAREFGISMQRVCDIFKGRSVFTEPAK